VLLSHKAKKWVIKTEVLMNSMRFRIFLVLTFCLLAVLAISSTMLVAQTGTDDGATPTLDPFPRPTDYGIIVAEQVFEHGRMFYIQMNGRIWVMVNDDEDGTSGIWTAYADTWTEDMPEFDPNIRPPDGLKQPTRGFGKLWRDNPDVREALGFAYDSEYGHWSRYTFEAGEMVETDNGDMVEQPGTHTLSSWYGGVYIFNEADGTWMLDPASIPPSMPEPTAMPEPTDESGN